MRHAADPSPHLLTDDHAIRRLLETVRTVAVLGAHPKPERPAHYVPRYLHERGLQTLPVNATRAGETLFGESVRASLEALEPGTLDLVDVFRRSEALPGHLDELLVARPRAVWFQLGIRHDEVARALAAAGIQVVQDRCLMVAYRRLVPPS